MPFGEYRRQACRTDEHAPSSMGGSGPAHIGVAAMLQPILYGQCARFTEARPSDQPDRSGRANAARVSATTIPPAIAPRKAARKTGPAGGLATTIRSSRGGQSLASVCSLMRFSSCECGEAKNLFNNTSMARSARIRNRPKVPGCSISQAMLLISGLIIWGYRRCWSSDKGPSSKASTDVHT